MQLYPGGEGLSDGFLHRGRRMRLDPSLLPLCLGRGGREGRSALLDGSPQAPSISSRSPARRRCGGFRRLRDGLTEIGTRCGDAPDLIAAIGPVTAQAVEEAGWPVGAMPQDSFHLKPMIVALGKRLSGDTSLVPPA